MIPLYAESELKMAEGIIRELMAPGSERNPNYFYINFERLGAVGKTQICVYNSTWGKHHYFQSLEEAYQFLQKREILFQKFSLA